MFEFTDLPMARRSIEPVLPCQRYEQLCIQLIDCTTHQGIPEVTVRFGNSHRDAKSFSAQPATFVHESISYTVCADGKTNDKGWVCFGPAVKQGAKAEIAMFNDYAIQVNLPGYRCRDSSGEVVPDGPAPTALTALFHFKPGMHRVAQATLRSDAPILSTDCNSTVTKLFTQTDRVRLDVVQAPNKGHQAAALSLLRNLRRLGYTGQIDVLTDNAPNLMDSRWSLQFNGFHANNAADAANAIFSALKTILGGTLDEPPVCRAEKWFAELNYDRHDELYVLLTAAHMRALKAAIPFPYTVRSDVIDLIAGAVPDDLTQVGVPGIAYTSSFTLKVDLKIVSLADESIPAKLATLDPRYRHNAEYGTVAWIERDVFDSDETANKRIIGLIAGHDLSKGTIETARTTRLKTHSVLALQPLLWHPDDRLLKIADQEAMPLCLPKSASYLLDRIEVDDPRPYAIERGMPATQADLFAAVLAKARTREVTLMTAYGVHQAHESSTDVVLRNLASAALHAVRKEGLSRKVVLVVSCKVSLAGMLRDARTRTVGMENADAMTFLDGLADDNLLLLHASFLPSFAFQLLVQASHFPVVLEGANTANLVQMLGKPYVSVSARTTPYVPLMSDALKSHEKLGTITAHLNVPDLASQAGPLGEAADYFHVAATTGDAFGAYFAALRTHVRGDNQDQLKLGLYRLGKALNPDPPANIPHQCGGPSHG